MMSRIRQRLGPAELEDLARGRVGDQRVGGEVCGVVDEDRSEQLRSGVRHRDDEQPPGKADEPVEGHVARSEDPRRADDRPRQAGAADGLLGPPLRPEPVALRVRRRAGPGQVDDPPDAGLAGRGDQPLGARRVDLDERLALARRLDR